MKRLGVPQVALLLAMWMGPLEAGGEMGSNAIGAVRSSEFPAASLIEVVLPGPLSAVEAFASASGERSLILLVEDGEGSEGPRFIYELRLGATVELSDLPVVLPAGADSLAAVDLAGDGFPELFVGEPGRIFRLTGEGRLELALEGQRVDLKSRARLGLDGSTVDAPELILVAVGNATWYTLDEEGGGLSKVEEVRLPVRAEMQGSWLRLSSPLVSALPRPGLHRELTYLVGPESIGARRLRTLILEPGGGSGASFRGRWSQLPTPETVQESQYALLDGEIVLLVSTVQADKHGIFEKKKFRVLRLVEDRSRSGVAPLLEVLTRTRNWYPTGVGVFDVNRDGFDDVILIQPKGLGGGKLVIEAFMGSGSGGFDGKTRRTDLEVETETWSYGKDVDLDGIPDLVLIEDEVLLVFTGVADTSSKAVLHREPGWRVVIGEVNDSLRVLDVLGDRRPEVLIIEEKGTGFESSTSAEEAGTEESREGQKEPIRGRLGLVIFSSPERG